jgi:hypothetical protein|tara:strand:- start:137 stop:346 length:210 start_codon:yes stop_codon:yes gene_type:complete
MVYEVKEINHVFQLSKGNDIVGVFRSEAALEDALKRLEAEEKPAPVEKPKKKKEKKWKKKSKNTGQSKS